MLADDCVVYREMTSLTESTEELQKDIHRLQNWASKWQMEFNVSKCYGHALVGQRYNPIPIVKYFVHNGSQVVNKVVVFFIEGAKSNSFHIEIDV